ncbi:TetR family transcriptional regulator [Streptomyces sp. NPDC001828]|uniref:TetR family transcriptional regulator n=1 Tax=Streptomyces sp. NPDC001828 TaxID=3364615 RepID=UPI0036CE0E8C
MENAQRGRRRHPDIAPLALEQTLILLQAHGYEGLRMKDIAAAAGVGLGALYRRWPGKEEMVVDALRADRSLHAAPDTADPLADLTASVERIITALPQGLGRLIAACVNEPDSALARVTRQAKLTPMIDTLTARLERVTAPAPHTRRRAESGLSYILWKRAFEGEAANAASLCDEALAIMGARP